jgi:hypothetical protein
VVDGGRLWNCLTSNSPSILGDTQLRYKALCCIFYVGTFLLSLLKVKTAEFTNHIIPTGLGIKLCRFLGTSL